MDGRLGNPGCWEGDFAAATGGGTAMAGAAPSRTGASLTSPTKRKPLRATVRISRCSSPLSPTALRTALIWLAKVDSETIRPSHTASKRLSLLTTWSRFATR